jgi:hypothetical protein
MPFDKLRANGRMVDGDVATQAITRRRVTRDMPRDQASRRSR